MKAIFLKVTKRKIALVMVRPRFPFVSQLPTHCPQMGDFKSLLHPSDSCRSYTLLFAVSFFSFGALQLRAVITQAKRQLLPDLVLEVDEKVGRLRRQGIDVLTPFEHQKSLPVLT